jgi:hypothetical protein
MIQSRESLEEALVHELIHAYDANVNKADFEMSTELACSEIRAASWAECKTITSEDEHRKCVIQTATQATENNFGTQADRLVNIMMDRCFPTSREEFESIVHRSKSRWKQTDQQT